MHVKLDLSILKREQKPHPVSFSHRRKRYPVKCEHTVSCKIELEPIRNGSPKHLLLASSDTKTVARFLDLEKKNRHETLASILLIEVTAEHKFALQKL